MIAPDSDPSRCLGYVEFRRKYDSDEEFRSWFAPAVEQIRALVTAKPAEAAARLMRVHNSLIELVDFLDPRKAWILMPRHKITSTTHPELFSSKDPSAPDAPAPDAVSSTD
jgi:hypothetical protein